MNVQFFNLASIETSGLDIEASYRWEEPLGLPGTFTMRGLATNVISYEQDTGIPGTIVRNTAGVNSGATPDWKVLGIQTYANGPLTLTLQERWHSDGTFGAQYTVCQTSCPVSSSVSPTIDRNYMSGALYWDIGAQYKFGEHYNLYGKVDNLLDREPSMSPGTGTGIGINPGLYDVLGRTYRLGLRVTF